MLIRGDRTDMSNIIVEEDSIKRPPNVLKSPPKAKDTKPFDIYVTEENNKYYHKI